eukprot:1930224-Prymnesium_polylepis.1
MPRTIAPSPLSLSHSTRSVEAHEVPATSRSAASEPDRSSPHGRRFAHMRLLAARLPLLRPDGEKLLAWECFLCVLSVYTCIATPLLLVFTETRFNGHKG